MRISAYTRAGHAYEGVIMPRSRMCSRPDKTGSASTVLRRGGTLRLPVHGYEYDIKTGDVRRQPQSASQVL